MAIEGSLDLFRLPEILQVISQDGKTGILTVQGEADIIAISFLGGQVVAADALNQTLEEALAQALASQGLVSPADFAAVAAEHQRGGGRLIDLLVERQVVGRPQLLAALRNQTYRLIAELLAWRSGEFKFYRGDEVSYEEGIVPISVEELLIRSVEEAAGDGSPTIPDARSVYERVEPVKPVRVRREGEEPADDGAIWVTESDMQVLEQLDGGRTVAALISATGSDEYKVRYGLHRLLEAGLVRRAGPPAEGAPPAAPQPPAERPAPGPAPAPAPVSRPAPAPAPAPMPGPAAAPGGRAVVDLPLQPVAEIPALAAAERRRPGLAAYQWIGRILAALPLLGAIAAVALAPSYLTLPFPWQQSQRLALERQVRESIFQRIDRAAKTAYLVEGQFPDGLDDLVDLRLLARADLSDLLGRSLAYSPGEYSYVVQPIAGGEPVPSTAFTEAVTGNFLLDPDFVTLPINPGEQPLVLLD